MSDRRRREKSRRCMDCGGPTYNIRCKQCIDAYRSAVPYRQLALRHYGYQCAKCPAVWERLRRGPLRYPTRRHEVDHRRPLALGGTSDMINLSVLCVRHHARKTRRDIAKMRHQPKPPAAGMPFLLLLLGLALAATYYVYGDTTRAENWAWLSIYGWGHYHAWLAWRRRKTHHRPKGEGPREAAISRLQTSLTETLGNCHVNVERWSRETPTVFEVRYLPAFPDSDPDKRTAVEQRVEAKLAMTFAPIWDTQADSVYFHGPDPLRTGASGDWPNWQAETLSLWEPIPVGRDATGRTVTVRLPEKSILIGGLPGGGKSVFQSQITATAMLDPTAKKWVMDGTILDNKMWRDCCVDFVGNDREKAITVLEGLRDEVDVRFEVLESLDGDVRKLTSELELPLLVLVIDELRYYLSGSGTEAKKITARITDLLIDLVSRGRKAGLITIAATQRPSATTIPTDLRDLFGYRAAFRCATPQSSNMILGDGWASAGYSAANIAGQAHGVHYLLHEEAQPVRVRSFHLQDKQLTAIALRAATLDTATMLGRSE